ncbi:MAG: L,D-transpeptidase family protein, partial [Epsilonproteobacteria bacterium]|nr:L,D-transpeptidase family protein [Campylobacterota bacterium]
DPNNWDTYVLINVPEYKFRLFENGTKVMEFKVIVGKYKWQTPIFSSTMKYIVINPTWNVPDNIARKEIIPHLVKDPVGYLKRHNMVVRRDYNIDSPPVDPRSVNWKKYLSKEWENKELPYKLIERASTRNALGQVKFMFPNRFSVYMHDTNKKYLFNNAQRSFSHGCIRLEKPFDLLRHISTNYTATPIENPKEYLALLRRKKKRDTTYINLVRTIPVHIVYLTAYVDEDGVVRFFNDIYRYDAIQHVRGLGSI